MAVSLHHKSWGSMDDALNLEDDDDNHSEVADALLGFFSDPFDASHLPLDSLFDSPTPTQPPPAADPSFDNHTFLSTTHASFSAPSSMSSTPPDLYAPIDDFRHLYHCWKRPRSCSDLYPPPSSDFSLDADDSFNAPARAAAGAGNRLQAPEPSAASASDWERNAAGGRCLSAQSVAARARRKRISDKTQELGRLIPGGNKMSTAEMFQAAFKYVKFLQAQVGMLSLMGSLQDRNEPREVEQRLQGLLGSMTVQEKLTGEGRCIVPEEAVNAMSKDGEVKSNPLIARELDRFIEQLHRSTRE